MTDHNEIELGVDEVWKGTVDQGKFVVVVTRRTATTATLRIFLQETGEDLLNEQVTLSWGAIFGPDVADVNAWSARSLRVIDDWLEAHP